MKFKRYSTAEDTYTTLPATFQTSGADAENYQVYGKTVENLADAIIEHANIGQNGRIFDPGAIDPAGDMFVLYIAPVVSGKTYTITTSTYDSAVVYAFYSTQPAYDAVSYNNTRTVLEGTHQATITALITGWIAFRDYVTAPAGMIVEGFTPAPIYVPPGTSAGAGVETENIFDSTKRQSYEGFWNNTGGYVSSSGWYGTKLIDVEPSTEYSFDPNSTAGASAKHLFYDENANLIGNIPSGSRTFTTPDNCVKMRFSYRSSSSNIMLTKGSTAPTSYIPYGYKIPILIQSGVTENLFDKDAKDTGNGYIGNKYIKDTEGSVGNDDNYFISEYIPVNSSTAYTLTNVRGTTGYSEYAEDKTYIQSVLYGSQNPVITTSATTKWVRLSIRKSLENAVTFTEGTTPPDHYIPYRYESNYDLFIGDSKLYEDEYLDFGEQKVWKRTKNLFDKDATFDVGYLNAGTGIVNPSNTNYRTTDYIKVTGQNVISLVNPYYSTSTGSLTRIALYDNAKTYISDVVSSSTRPEQYSATFDTGTGEKYIRISIRITDYDIMLVSGSTAPETYIPYLQPTDPPTPFPTLTTYIGENNLSVDTTVQPEKVVLEYAGWREIDAKKYVNGEWVTITPKQYTGGGWS